MNVDDAEEYTQSLGQNLAGGWRLAALGIRLGVPTALGLSDEAWRDERLGGAIRLSIPERRDAVAELDAEGMSQRQIAAALGVSQKTVDRDLGPESDDSPPVPEQVEDLGPESDDSPPHVTRNSGNDEWYTPTEYIHAARDVLGSIDLDPASSPIANETVKADRYYTIDDDGLAQPWEGRVWMNPPYSTGLVERFVLKLLDSYGYGNVKAAVVLTNNATDTRWWQSLARRSSGVCMLAGRIKFRSEAGDIAGAGLQGQTISYLGEDRNVFYERFGQFGVVL